MSFDPDQPLISQIRIVENALIVPFGGGPKRGMSREAGVYDADGNYVPEATCYREPGLPTTTPLSGPLPEATGETMAGTYLFGGLLYGHFGHFLAESTARFWVKNHVKGMNGEIFMSKPNKAKTLPMLKDLRPLLKTCGLGSRSSHCIVKPVRVERLVVAPQGFGLGDMIAGSPEYRAYMKENMGRKVAAEGAERIYISRSRLFSRRGRYFGEAQMEHLLEAEGYRIFHPQDHSVDAQIAQYKAAKQIISSDSSALHLTAFFTAPSDKIAIVVRRPGSSISDYIMQFKYFSDHAPDVISCLTGRMFQYEGALVTQTSEVYAELDFPALGAQLAQQGYIRDAAPWQQPDDAALEAERAGLSARLGLDIRQVTS